MVSTRSPRRRLPRQRATVLAQVGPTAPAVQDAVTAANESGATSGLSVTASASAQFVTISVSSPKAAVATAVANAYITTLEPSTDRLAGTTSTAIKLTALAPASRPVNPYSPQPKRDVALGLAAGLVLGFALAILRNAFNTAVRDSDELKELTELTVLGTVPRDLPKKSLPAATHPRSARAEGYRQVRTTLLNQYDQRPLTISVTSATISEGKTSVACNLAVVFSRAGHRVALIDADLRRPKVATYFGLSSFVGLTDVLAGSAPLSQATQIFDGGRLAIVPSGRIAREPSELLGSDRMRDVLKQLAEEYEIVIIDTPPVLPVTDALVIAPHVDGVVLVVRLGRTTRNRVTNAVSAIERVTGVIAGVVPNQAGRGKDVDYRYPYRYKPTRRKRGKKSQFGESRVGRARVTWIYE